ncbi:hypothetical protein T484DRAFT_2083854 [Baffinella frigidus]|nr:hypothetical protein T484DRAFT_2083854 [Cryptophyta sp. CCMP2293]
MLAPPPDISLRDERIHLLLAGSELSLALLSLDARVHVSAGLEALKREPPVMRTLEKWWEWVPRPQSYMMETASFLSLNALLYEHLVPELCAANPHGAWRAAEVDWVAAGGSEGAINFSQFSNTLLTLADNFSPGGSEPEVLVEFLNGLLARMKARLDREAARPESVEEEPTGSTEQALTSIHEDDDVLADVLLFSQPRRTKQRPSSGVRARFVGPDDAGRSEEVMEQGQERDAMLLSSRRLVTSAGRRPPLGGPGHLLRRSSSGDMVMNLELAMGAIARQDTRRKSRVFLNPSSSATMNVGLSQLGKPGAQARGTRRQHIASDSLRPASAMERPLSAASVDLRPASASPGQSYPVRVRPTTAGIVRRPPQSKAAGKAERPQSALSSGPQRPHSAMESAADTEMGVEAAEQGGVHARPRTAVGYQHPGEVGLQPAARAVRNNSVVAAAALATASGDAASPSSPSAGISSLLREISGSSSSQSWSQGGGSTTVSPFPAKAVSPLAGSLPCNLPRRVDTL